MRISVLGEGTKQKRGLRLKGKYPLTLVIA